MNDEVERVSYLTSSFIVPRSWLPQGIRMIQRAKSSIARCERADRVVQIVFGKIRPEDVADVQLGVADLPEEIVADAHLAGGADEQIRVGCAGGVEVFGDGFFGDLVGGELAGFNFLSDCEDDVDDLGAVVVYMSEY